MRDIALPRTDLGPTPFKQPPAPGVDELYTTIPHLTSDGTLRPPVIVQNFVQHAQADTGGE